MKSNKLKNIKTNFYTLSNRSLSNVYPQLNIKDNRKKPFSIKEDTFKIPEQFDYQRNTENKHKSVTISNAELAMFFMNDFIFLNVDDTLYHWNSDTGIYVVVNTEYAEKFIRRNIPKIHRNRINSNTIKEIIQWIKSEIHIEATYNHLKAKVNLISFLNGVLNIEQNRFSPHHPDHFFTSVINAEYREGYLSSGNNFEKFLNDITDGNRSLYLRVQELFGYVISEIRNVKYIPYLLGPKDTGKSIVLKMLEHIVGKDSYTNLSFEQLNKPEYLAQLLGKRLNTCGETSEFKLTKLDVFKKLSGGDHVTARPIYGQPVNFINSAVLLFAGNHLPTINGIDKSNAFSQRIIIFPFQNQIPKSNQDPQLFEKLLREKEYIVRWAIKGLIRWKENNYQFTSYKEIEVLTDTYYEQNNSIDSFIKTHCKEDFNFQIYKSEFEEAYIKYCKNNDITPESTQELHRYIKSLSNISYKRFRDGQGNNKYGYKGITLKNWG